MVLFLMFKLLFYCEKTQGNLTLHREITGKTNAILFSGYFWSSHCNILVWQDVMQVSSSITKIHSYWDDQSNVAYLSRLSSNPIPSDRLMNL